MPDFYQLLLSISTFILLPLNTLAQDQTTFLDQRAEEDYNHLKDSTNLAWPDAIKYLSLTKKRNAYLSLGGSFRPRFEHFTNNNWIEDNNQNYYTQRLALHADLHLGSLLRIFVELQHGYKSGEPEFLQTDDLDVHQAFIEIQTSGQHPVTFRFGRQEMKLGIGRLVDLRVGPNVRRTFDLGKLTFHHEKFSLDAFYGKEAQVGLGAFDNDFTLFTAGANNPRLWGIFSQLPIHKNNAVKHTIEFYYLGFQADFSAFNDGSGEETRHSIGARSLGSINRRFQYNT
ncbi:MAG: alginate export family protein, partial [Bacteroidota bacterium]